MITSLRELHRYNTIQTGRFIDNETLLPLLKNLGSEFELSEIGKSESGRSIYMVKYGNGKNRVLGWSQMHGNEGTTTRGILHFFNFLLKNELESSILTAFKENYTLYIIPILNPDGAAAYTRENANGVDLNRDATDLTQVESKVLREQIDAIKPDLCLNLHDQRSIYGLPGKKPSTLSFLSPAADEDRTLTEPRMISMSHIIRMRNLLETLVPGQIGRYDDNFNPNCTGDRCVMDGMPTILFEAGHYGDDYRRDIPSLLVFYSLLGLFGLVSTDTEVDYEEYFEIPENNSRFNDVLVRNALVKGSDELVDIGIQFKEVLTEREISFIPVLDGKFKPGEKWGHKEIDAGGRHVLINSHQNPEIGEEIVSIIDDLDENRVYYPNN